MEKKANDEYYVMKDEIITSNINNNVIEKIKSLADPKLNNIFTINIGGIIYEIPNYIIEQFQQSKIYKCFIDLNKTKNTGITLNFDRDPKIFEQILQLMYEPELINLIKVRDLWKKKNLINDIEYYGLWNIKAKLVNHQIKLVSNFPNFFSPNNEVNTSFSFNESNTNSNIFLFTEKKIPLNINCHYEIEVQISNPGLIHIGIIENIQHFTLENSCLVFTTMGNIIYDNKIKDYNNRMVYDYQESKPTIYGISIQSNSFNNKMKVFFYKNKPSQIEKEYLIPKKSYRIFILVECGGGILKMLNFVVDD